MRWVLAFGLGVLAGCAALSRRVRHHHHVLILDDDARRAWR